MRRPVGRPNPASALDWVAGMFPIDGPQEPARVVAAGAVLAEVVRYLAHATQAGRGELAAPQLCALLSGLGRGGSSWSQLCRQLADRLSRLVADPTLRADALGPAVDPGQLAADAAGYLDVAAGTAAELGRLLGSAASATSRLYHDNAGGAR